MTFKNSFSVLFVLSVIVLPGCKDTAKVEQHKDVKHKRNVSSEYIKLPLNNGVNQTTNIEGDDLGALFDDQDDQTVALNDVDQIVLNVDSAWDEVAENQHVLKTIHFDFDDNKIRKQDQEILAYDVTVLNEQIKQLTDAGNTVEVLVEGHTCKIGTDKHNKVLSLNRAKTVEQELVAHGIDVPVKSVGRGSMIPALVDGKPVDGTKRDELAPNRRVEIRLITT